MGNFIKFSKFGTERTERGSILTEEFDMVYVFLQTLQEPVGVNDLL